MWLHGSRGSGVSHSTPSRVTRYGLKPSTVEAFTNLETTFGMKPGKEAHIASQFWKMSRQLPS